MAGENEEIVTEDAAEVEAPVAQEEAQESPAPGGVRGAIAEARARLAEGKPLIPADEEEEDAAPEPTGEGATAAEEEGSEEEALDAGGGEEDEDAPGEEEGADEGEGEDAESDDELVVFRLPPRNPNEEELEVELPKELEEHFNRLKNGYMRGEAAREVLSRAEAKEEELRADREEIQLIDSELEADPVGFVSKRVAPQYRKALLMELLADDELWGDEKLQNNLREWEHSPETREQFRTKVERDRLKEERERDNHARARKVAREGAAKTAAIVRSFMDGEDDIGRREKFHRLAMTQLGELAAQTGRTEFTQKEVIEYLDRQGILNGYGLDPSSLEGAAPGKTGADASPPRQEGDRPKGRKPAVRARRVTAEEARETGKRLKEGSQRRRAAGSYAPTGAGAPAAGVELPKGQTVKERIAFVRRRGIANIMSEA
jgi:hypothetical protein